MSSKLQQEKVFCIGFSKTATTSLGKAFEILGYRVCKGHWQNHYSNFLVALYVNRDFNELLRIVDHFDAFSDAPWGGTEVYKLLAEQRPGSKFILTLREPESWYQSLEKMLTIHDKNLETALDSCYAQGWYSTPYFFRDVFNIQTLKGEKSKIIDVFQSYNTEAESFLKKEGLDHLVIQLERGISWSELCSFLGDSIPPTPFPMKNVYKDAFSTEMKRVGQTA